VKLGFRSSQHPKVFAVPQLEELLLTILLLLRSFPPSFLPLSSVLLSLVVAL